MRSEVQLLVVLWLLCVPQAAHAYIDPGSGSLIIQALIAGLLTLSVVFRRTLGALVLRFRRLIGRSPDKSTDGK